MNTQTIAFIANVGSRDVQVQNQPSLPRDSRPLGEMLWDNWDTIKNDITFPIMVKALEDVLKKHGRIDELVLFATDQEDAKYRHTDTVPFALLIERHLVEKQGEWIRPLIKNISIRKNPADYDSMLHFYQNELAKLAKHDLMYIEVTGGTPAMSFMLLWQGVELLGERAQPLYVLQDRSTPLNLNIGRELLIKTLVEDLKASFEAYQYPAILVLLDNRRTFLHETWPFFDVLYALVDFARHRFNFNFEQAEKSLESIQNHLEQLTTEQAKRIIHLYQDINTRNEAWLLREEIFATELDLEKHAYKDALTNVFAFQEGFLRMLVIQSGAKLVDDNRKLDKVWLDAHPELKKYLAEKNIDFNRNVTTFVFERILGFWAKTDPKLEEINSKIEQLKSLAELRNAAIHSHQGVSVDEINKQFKPGVNGIHDILRQLYKTLTDTSAGINPYKTINQLCIELIEANV